MNDTDLEQRIDRSEGWPMMHTPKAQGIVWKVQDGDIVIIRHPDTMTHDQAYSRIKAIATGREEAPQIQRIPTKIIF